MTAEQRHRRRGGVPPDHLLAAGGGAADDRRQRRPRHAAVRPDRPRDGRPARARRLHHARQRPRAVLHRHGRDLRRGRRPPPPADRALPHRRARHPVGRRARGGRAARARDVAGARGAHARRHRRRQDLSPRPSDRRRQPHRGRSARRLRARRLGADPALRERGRGPPALPPRPRDRAGPEGHVRGLGERRGHGRARRQRDRAHAARSPRRSPSWPTRRRRRASRCPSSS